MQIYLAAAPQEVQTAAKFGQTLAHAAYRIGQDSSLLRKNPPLQSQGGLLSVSDRNAPVIADPKALCAAVLRECSRRSYTGVVLDFEEPLRQNRKDFVEQLGQVLAKQQRTLYVPEAYAQAAPSAMVLVGTALSGGNLAQRLREAAARYGGRLALDAERVQMDFPLPCSSGTGKPLAAEEFAALRQQRSVFFSPDLCARYFTYKARGEPHFVLFDDADTLKRKLRLGAEAGARAALFQWPEVADIAEELFR